MVISRLDGCNVLYVDLPLKITTVGTGLQWWEGCWRSAPLVTVGKALWEGPLGSMQTLHPQDTLSLEAVVLTQTATSSGQELPMHFIWRSKQPEQWTGTIPRRKFSPNECFLRVDFPAFGGAPGRQAERPVWTGLAWAAWGYCRAALKAPSGQGECDSIAPTRHQAEYYSLSVETPLAADYQVQFKIPDPIFNSLGPKQLQKCLFCYVPPWQKCSTEQSLLEGPPCKQVNSFTFWQLPTWWMAYSRLTGRPPCFHHFAEWARHKRSGGNSKETETIVTRDQLRRLFLKRHYCSMLQCLFFTYKTALVNSNPMSSRLYRK